MENITDLLSTIFVSNKQKAKKRSEVKHNLKDLESYEISSTSGIKSNLKSDIQSYKISSDSSLLKDSSTSNVYSQESNSESELVSSKVYSSEIESNSDSNSGSVSDVVSDTVSDVVSDTVVSDTVVSDTVSYVASDVVSDVASDVVSDVASEESVKHKVDIKKTELDANDLYKNHILLVNDENSSNIEIINNLLLKLSKLNKLYDSSLHIFTFRDNKTAFRDMILQQPQLYFNDLVIKTHFSIPKLNSNKRHLFIVDYSLIKDKLDQLLDTNLNAHIIIFHDTYSSELVNVYNSLGKSVLLINKKDKLKILQSRFYSKVLKYLCNNVDDINNVDDYLEIVKSTDNLKYLIIKNNKLRYL